jgi:polysaccharide export outer membrane protein
MPRSTKHRPLFFLLVAGFGSAAFAQQPAPEVTTSASPAAVAKAIPIIDGNYVLSPQDVVEISVFQEDELGVKARIGEDGTVQMPLLGAVRIGGRTVRQAQAIIEEALKKDYLVAPQVSISVADFAKRRFAVLGQVQKPGTYELPGNEVLDLMQAIGIAGGYTRSANPGKIIVKRVVQGSEKIFRLNGKEMARGAAERFRIQAGDTITVEESFF